MCAQSDDAVEGRLYPSDTICYGEIDGLVVVLDLTTQAYLILNEKATLIWKLLLQMEGDLAQTSCALREPSLKSELSSLAKECVERGFLSSSKKVRPRPCQARRPGAKRSFFLGLRAWWSLLSTAYVLRVKGFSRTYREYAQLPLRAAPDPEKLLPAAQKSFLRAENFFWYRSAPDDCLPRSLALFRFLRTIGVPVVHCIGGRRFPGFTMHAWVEHSGLAVLDEPGRVKEYTRLALIPYD
jgi:hypothetical protein